MWLYYIATEAFIITCLCLMILYLLKNQTEFAFRFRDKCIPHMHEVFLVL